MGLVGNGATLEVMRGMRSGAATLVVETRRNVVRRRLHSAHELLYKERKAIIEGRRRPQEAMSFRKFEETMEEITTYVTRMKGSQAEQAYRKKIEQYKVPLYGDLKPGKKG